MRDSSILKLAAGAGLLAFVLRFALVQPEDLGVERVGPRGGSALSGPLFEAEQAAAAGDFAGALRIISQRQIDAPYDQRGWNAIGAFLVGLGEPDAAMQVWRTTAPEALNARRPGEAWAAYFMGYQHLSGRGRQELAQRSFELSAQAFEEYLQHRAQRATAWDWLYAARANMRLGNAPEVAEAMERVVAMIDLKPTRSSASDMEAIVRSAGRTWAGVGMLDEARSLWDRWTDEAGPEGVGAATVNGWLGFASSLGRLNERPAALLAVQQAQRRLEVIEAVETVSEEPLPSEFVDLWRRIGLSLESLEGAGAGESALRRAAQIQATILAADPSGEGWFTLARLHANLGAYDETILAVEQAYRTGWLDPDRAMTLSDFEPVRDDPRFRTIMDAAYTDLDSRFAQDGEASRNAPRRGPRRE